MYVTKIGASAVRWVNQFGFARPEICWEIAAKKFSRSCHLHECNQYALLLYLAVFACIFL